MNTNWNATQGNAGDDEYNAFLLRLSQHYTEVASQQPVFKTEDVALWNHYLAAFAPEDRQTHNCNACHHFIKRFGGLVTIDPATGKTASAFWDPELAPANYRAAVRSMKAAVEKAKVTAPFYSDQLRFGTAKTGNWTHMYADNPKVHSDPLKTAAQLMAEKREGYLKLRRALTEYSATVADRVVQMLQAGTLPRSDKYLQMAETFMRLRQDVDMIPKSRENFTWLAVARGCGVPSALEVLLDGVKSGHSFERIKGVWSSVTDVNTYQQKQTPPASGNIVQAEKAVEKLGIAPSFDRRYTTGMDLMHGTVWVPRVVVLKASAVGKSEAGVFSHLKPKVDPALPELDIPPKRITWEKFQRDVLPGAAEIAYRAPLVGRFCALTAAVDPAAPQILRWDSPEARNTISWSFPSPAATAQQWNLTPGTLVPVEAIVDSPNQWGREAVTHDKGAFLLLKGAKDTRGHPGGGLFIEHLRSELNPYRATIQAHLNKLVVQGADDPDTMAFGIGYMAGGEFTELAAPKTAAASGPVAGPAVENIHVILVIDDSGSMSSHISAARKAVASLADGVRAMGGNVDVTLIRFGTLASTLFYRQPVSKLLGIEGHFSGRSGGTALNDTLVDVLNMEMNSPDARRPDTAFFLGIVTDGKDESSRRFDEHHVSRAMLAAQQAGNWTVAFAGAKSYGYNPAGYALCIGIPEGNVKVFTADERGFEDVGSAYASSTRTLSAGYRSGQRASTSFFSATSTHQALGKDYPVFVVTNLSGTKSVYEIDRWD